MPELISYATLRTVHISCALLSISGFTLRGLLMLRNSPLLAQRWVRILPHLNDTVLLAAAISLMVWSGQYPGQQAWLSAKLLGLLAYIGFGFLALRPRRPQWLRSLAFVLALLCAGWLISVAVTRRPAGFLASLI